MNISANCVSVSNNTIIIDLSTPEVYPNTYIQFAEYDQLQNIVGNWTNVATLNSTQQSIQYNFGQNTQSIRLRLATNCTPTTTTTTTAPFSGTLLTIVTTGQAVSTDGISFNSNAGSSFGFTPSTDLSSLPSSFTIYVNNEERAVVTFWGQYIGQPFIFVYNNNTYNGIFTSSNRIDFTSSVVTSTTATPITTTATPTTTTTTATPTTTTSTTTAAPTTTTSTTTTTTAAPTTTTSTTTTTTAAPTTTTSTTTTTTAAPTTTTSTPTTTTEAPGAWIQRGTDIDSESISEEIGYAVSLSGDGNVLALSDPNYFGGFVQTYAWNGSTWSKRGFRLEYESLGDDYGYSMSLNDSGTILAVGGPFNNGNGSDSGHVRVFSWNGTTWVQRGVDINGGAAGDGSGYSTSLSSDGNIIAIGAPFNGANRGYVRIYVWNGSSWIQRGGDINGTATDNQSGYSVSLNGNGSVVAVGAPFNSTNDISSGQVRVFAWSGSNWVQRGSTINGTNMFDQIGTSISLSNDGNTLAIGAPYADNNGLIDNGNVRVYRWNNSSWVEIGNISGEVANDKFGHSVSLSDSGNILAVGAINNDGNGFDSGRVTMYIWDGLNWIQRGNHINGEAAGDGSGYAVSLSNDGSVVAIAAPFNNGGATNDKGHIRIYSWQT